MKTVKNIIRMQGKIQDRQHKIAQYKISSQDPAPAAHRTKAGVMKCLAVGVGSAWTRPTIKTIVSMLRSDFQRPRGVLRRKWITHDLLAGSVLARATMKERFS